MSDEVVVAVDARDESTNYVDADYHSVPDKIGKVKVCWNRHPHSSSYQAWPQICLSGPDRICASMTFVFMITASVLYVSLVAPMIHVGVIVGGSLWFIGLLISYLFAAHSDPGYVRKQTVHDLERQRQEIISMKGPEQAAIYFDTHTICSYCNVMRESGTVHCYYCDVCVIDLDHHCQYIGQCAGRYNMLYFKIFVFFMVTSVAFVVASVIVWLLVTAVRG